MEYMAWYPKFSLSFFSSYFFFLFWHVVPFPVLISADGFLFALSSPFTYLFIWFFYGKIYITETLAF